MRPYPAAGCAGESADWTPLRTHTAPYGLDSPARKAPAASALICRFRDLHRSAPGFRAPDRRRAPCQIPGYLLRADFPFPTRWYQSPPELAADFSVSDGHPEKTEQPTFLPQWSPRYRSPGTCPSIWVSGSHRFGSSRWFWRFFSQ